MIFHILNNHKYIKLNTILIKYHKYIKLIINILFEFCKSCCVFHCFKKKRLQHSRVAIIQNSTVLLSLKVKLDERPLLSTEKSSPSEPLRKRRRSRPLSFPFKTRGWLYLGSSVEAAPISEARYTTFYRRGFIRPSPC